MLYNTESPACDNLEGLDGKGGRGAQEKRDIYICIAVV